MIDRVLTDGSLEWQSVDTLAQSRYENFFLNNLGFDRGVSVAHCSHSAGHIIQPLTT